MNIQDKSDTITKWLNKKDPGCVCETTIEDDKFIILFLTDKSKEMYCTNLPSNIYKLFKKFNVIMMEYLSCPSRFAYYIKLYNLDCGDLK